MDVKDVHEDGNLIHLAQEILVINDLFDQDDLAIGRRDQGIFADWADAFRVEVIAADWPFVVDGILLHLTILLSLM